MILFEVIFTKKKKHVWKNLYVFPSSLTVQIQSYLNSQINSHDCINFCNSSSFSEKSRKLAEQEVQTAILSRFCNQVSW